MNILDASSHLYKSPLVRWRRKERPGERSDEEEGATSRKELRGRSDQEEEDTSFAAGPCSMFILA